MTLRRLILAFSLRNVTCVGLIGPGLTSVIDTYTAQCPTMSICSIMMVPEKLPHSTWKYLKSSSSTSVSGASPGGIMAGAKERTQICRHINAYYM